ncbi:MAG: SLC13 family permease [Anaerolineae bacterium]|nr:SLC13 family permease [Anaerolineae bacterium]
MTVAQLYVIFAVGLPLSLTAANRLRADYAALMIAFILGIGQALLGLPIFDAAGMPASAAHAISGFGQPVIITLVSLFILTGSLEKHGIAHWIAQRIAMIGSGSTRRLIALYTIAAAALSLVMNTVAAGALLLPSALQTARQANIAPSRLLMPLSFGTLLGGCATYFTTANIITSGLLTTASPPQTPLSVLDFALTGGLIALAGIAYIVILAPRLLPERTSLWRPAMSVQPVSLAPKTVLLSLLILTTSIGAAILGVPTYLAMLGGALATLLVGLVTPDEVYELVEWRTIFLVAGMYSIGMALTHTGIAAALGQIVVRAVQPFGALGLASGVFWLTVALTHVIGGQVTPLVAVPIAISAALQFGVNVHAIAITAAIACSTAYLSPVAHPVNMIVVQPADYRFSDFFRLGSGLTVLCFMTLLVGLKLFWNL